MIGLSYEKLVYARRKTWGLYRKGQWLTVVFMSPLDAVMHLRKMKTRKRYRIMPRMDEFPLLDRRAS
jgi:hypothetical protein